MKSTLSAARIVGIAFAAAVGALVLGIVGLVLGADHGARLVGSFDFYRRYGGYELTGKIGLALGALIGCIVGCVCAFRYFHSRPKRM
ncbi:MAG: hypothetical protein QM784_27740 [Polyangiaceae bacterium]